MACINYKATYSSSASKTSVNVVYVDCNGNNRSIAVQRGTSQEFCSSEILTDVGLVQDLSVVSIGLCTTKVLSNELEIETQTDPLFVRWYQIKACGLSNSIILYTDRKPKVSGERVGISNSSEVGVPTNTLWVYNGKSSTSINSPGTEAVGIVGTGLAGCPNLSTTNTESTSILTEDPGECRRYRLKYRGRSNVILTWTRCSDGTTDNRTLTTDCTVEFSALRGSVKLSANLQEIALPSSVPASDYDLTDNGQHIAVNSEDFITIDCTTRTPAEEEVTYAFRAENRNPQTITIAFKDLNGTYMGVEIPSFTYLEFCTIDVNIAVGDEVQTDNLKIIPKGACQDDVLKRGDLERPVEVFNCEKYQVTNNHTSRLTLRYPVCPAPTGKVAYITLEPGETDTICVFQGGTRRFIFPTFFSKKSLGECGIGTACRGFRIVNKSSRDSVTVTVPKCFEKDACYQSKVLAPREEWSVCLSANFYMDVTDGDSNNLEVYHQGTCDEPTCSDPTDNTNDDGGVPTEFIDVTFREIINPQIPSDVQFNKGEIKLNGQVIGYGSVTKSIKLGTSHTVTFGKPSAKNYVFSAGAPSKVNFTVTRTDTLYESIFNSTFAPTTGELRVITNYDPFINGTTKKGRIYINGDDFIGQGSATEKLEPGEYVVSFEDIDVQGMVYETPSPIRVVLEAGQTQTVRATYRGSFVPDGSWLKMIDSIDKVQYNSLTTKGLFSGGISNLTTYFVSSSTTPLGEYYAHIYDKDFTSNVTASIQFSTAYGHYYGSGSADSGGQYSDTISKAIYGQYRSIILGHNSDKFNLTGQDTNHFYVISYQKDRRDTRTDYKALEINLAHLSGSQFISGSGTMSTHTGSNVQLSGDGSVLRLISDYKINTQGSYQYPGSPLEFNIVSGSIEDGVYNAESPHYYGKLYPSIGAILLDANKLDMSASFGTVTSREVAGNNELKIFTSISGSALYQDGSGDYLGMKARATKEELVYHYFMHVKNEEFNYSTNHTFYSSGSGEIISDFIDQPKTYITSIGLYDKDRNLVAVGKVSRPELKSFTDEVLFDVKLKF